MARFMRCLFSLLVFLSFSNLLCAEHMTVLWVRPSLPGDPRPKVPLAELSKREEFRTLQELYIEDCDLAVIPANAFACCPNLRVLHITGSLVKEIAPGAFDGLGELVELSLSDNELMALPVGFCSQSPKLAILSLYRNHISYLPSDLWCRMRALQSLDISNNELRSLPSDLLKCIPRYRAFLCAYNPCLKSCPKSLKCVFYWDRAIHQAWLRSCPTEWIVDRREDGVILLEMGTHFFKEQAVFGTTENSTAADWRVRNRHLHLFADAMLSGDVVLRGWGQRRFALPRVDFSLEKPRPLVRELALYGFRSEARDRDRLCLQYRLGEECFNALMAQPEKVPSPIAPFGRPSDASSVTVCSPVGSPKTEPCTLVSRCSVDDDAFARELADFETEPIGLKKGAGAGGLDRTRSEVVSEG